MKVVGSQVKNVLGSTLPWRLRSQTGWHTSTRPQYGNCNMPLTLRKLAVSKGTSWEISLGGGDGIGHP